MKLIKHWNKLLRETGISILRDFQNMTGPGPEEPDLSYQMAVL